VPLVVININNGLSEEDKMTLKEVLAAGKAEILSAISVEAAQHAAKIEELAAQIGKGDLTPEELQTELSEVASGIRGIVPDPVAPPVEESPDPPTSPGE
jgi:ABC-type molybdenum transport system ATPase subunit/photorepair protein PhrA